MAAAQAQTAPPTAAPAPAIAHVAPALPAPEEPVTLKLGTICERLGFAVSAAFLAESLGIMPARAEGRLYRPSDFDRICAALHHHIERVRAGGRVALASASKEAA